MSEHLPLHQHVLAQVQPCPHAQGFSSCGPNRAAWNADAQQPLVQQHRGHSAYLIHRKWLQLRIHAAMVQYILLSKLHSQDSLIAIGNCSTSY
jgi:hypothetical protein